jgi:hypothetical protein
VARCTVERLMKHLGLQGVRRGKVVRVLIGLSHTLTTGSMLSNVINMGGYRGDRCA